MCGEDGSRRLSATHPAVLAGYIAAGCVDAGCVDAGCVDAGFIAPALVARWFRLIETI
jgi:hypothetical protein